MLPAALLAVALLGAAFMLKGGGSSPAATGAVKTEASVPVVDPAHVVSLAPITLNLADGGFLKLGLALQLATDTPLPADPVPFGARALDEAITVFGGHSRADLAGGELRDKVKKELSDRLAAAYDHHVVAVYFTQFVMQ